MPPIRQAGPDDIPAIAAVIDAAYRHYIPIIGRTPRPMLDDHAARVARGEHYLVEHGGRAEAVLTLGPVSAPMHSTSSISPSIRQRRARACCAICWPLPSSRRVPQACPG